MLTTQQKTLRRFWYPVMPEAALADGPAPFTLLGENIVLWKNPDGTLACIQDRCCHKTARLSKGWIDKDRVVCAYHGWEYDATGACVRIPQQPDPEQVAPEIRVDTYNAEIRYGHVWVALGEPLTGIPEIPEEAEGFRRIDEFYEEWKIAPLRLMENSFDNSHIAFTHRETLGSLDAPKPSKNEIEEFDFGLQVRTEIPIKNRDGSAEYFGEDRGEEVVRTMNSTWFMPFVRRLGITYPDGLRHTVITAATPVTDDRSMFVQWSYRSDTEDEVSAESIIDFDRRVIDEDKIILETTDPDVPLDTKSPLEFHMQSDLPGVRMRRMLGQLLADQGEAEVTRTAA